LLEPECEQLDTITRELGPEEVLYYADVVLAFDDYNAT
jgi:hypothetical protein